MFLGDVPNQSIPSGNGRRTRDAVITRFDAARGRGGGEEDDLGAVQRGDGAGEAVPGILADEHRGAAPRRVERAHLTTALDESFLVEQAVGGQKHFAVNVADHWTAVGTESDVHGTVVQGALPPFVEPDDDIEGSTGGYGGGDGRAIRLVQLPGQRAG